MALKPVSCTAHGKQLGFGPISDVAGGVAICRERKLKRKLIVRVLRFYLFVDRMLS